LLRALRPAGYSDGEQCPHGEAAYLATRSATEYLS